MSLPRVGDVVKIVEMGRLYSTYKDMAQIMKLKNFQYAFTPEYGVDAIGKVLKKREHEWNNQLLCGVRLFGVKRDIIIATQALKVIKFNNFFVPDEMFEI